MTNSTPKNKGSKKQTSGRGSSDVFQRDNKENDHGNVHALKDPLITNGECERCPFNGDIVSESISCSICCNQYHALCRDKKGSFTNSSICSKNFFEMYGPLSAHYGNNKTRWGQFIFMCKRCNSNYPGLFPKTDTGAFIDVVNLVKSPTKCLPSSKCNEAQTLISGNLSGYNSDCDSDKDLDIASDIKKLTNLNMEVLDNIKTLQQLSSDHASKFSNEIGNLMTQIKSGFPAQSPTNQFNRMEPSSTLTPKTSDKANFDFDVEQCKPFKDIQENVLNQELLAKIVDFLDNSTEFNTIQSNNSSRDVSYYGEFKYRYGATQHEAKKIPDIFEPIVDLLSTKYPTTIINSCLVTRYKNGSNTIPKHSDDEPFIAPSSDIFTFSIGSERSMSFTSVNGDLDSMNLPNNSLLTFSRASQEFWKHEIPHSESSSVRYSLTFRQLAPYYANSTLVVGDSNTQNLKFGAGRNTFGVWMPGCRVKASKIDDIPGPDEMDFPYRNLVIHCGINDLRNDNHLPIPVLMTNLANKCLALGSKFAKMKIHISMLLPTKDPGLNSMVSEFNRRIKDFSDKHTNIMIIPHHNLANSSGMLTHELGRHKHDGGAMMFDTVHLGSKGISIFCANIKSCIFKKKVVKHDNGLPSSNTYSKFPFWNPNPNYKPSTRPLPSHSYPWTGEHSGGFSVKSPQPFQVNSFYNGYQS